MIRPILPRRLKMRNWQSSTSPVYLIPCGALAQVVTARTSVTNREMDLGFWSRIWNLQLFLGLNIFALGRKQCGRTSYYIIYLSLFMYTYTSTFKSGCQMVPLQGVSSPGLYGIPTLRCWYTHIYISNSREVGSILDLGLLFLLLGP